MVAILARCSFCNNDPSAVRLYIFRLSVIPLVCFFILFHFALLFIAVAVAVTVFLLGRLPIVCGHVLEQLISLFVEPLNIFIVFVNFDANFLSMILPFADCCLSVERFNEFLLLSEFAAYVFV